MDILLYDTGRNQVWLTLNVKANPTKLDSLANRWGDTTLLKRRIGYLMRRAFAKRFEEGGPGWAADAESTVAAKLYGGQPPVGKNGKLSRRFNNPMTTVNPAASVLIASGALRDSYVQKNHPNHVSSVQETDEGFVVIEGSKDPKAEYHQKGTSPYQILPKNAKALRFIGRGGSVVFRRIVNHPGLPARPVELLAGDLKRIEKEVEEFYQSGNEVT